MVLYTQQMGRQRFRCRQVMIISGGSFFAPLGKVPTTWDRHTCVSGSWQKVTVTALKVYYLTASSRATTDTQFKLLIETVRACLDGTIWI